MVLDHGRIIEYDKTENLLSNEKSNFYICFRVSDPHIQCNADTDPGPPIGLPLIQIQIQV